MLDDRHLRRMTDNIGMLQFSALSAPDAGSGYTLDDNARALIAALFLEDGQELALKYARFMYRAQQPDGSWSNLYNHGRYYSQFDSDDSIGRALIAAALGISSTDETLAKLCQQMFSFHLPKSEQFTSPRGIAYTLLALCKHPQPDEYQQWLRDQLCEHLLSLYHNNRSQGWYWFENYLTYCNGILPQALFAVYRINHNRRIRRVAYESVNFLNDILFRHGRLDIIGNEGWYQRSRSIPLYDQQPVDAASIIFACYEAYQTTGNRDYRELAFKGYKWYMGENAQGMPLYDNRTGGCFDALTNTGVNQNQGAEAVLSFMLSTMLLLGKMEQTNKNDNELVRASLA